MGANVDLSRVCVQSESERERARARERASERERVSEEKFIRNDTGVTGV